VHSSHFPPGNYRGIEWAGARFHERWMFVNIQTPGITLAITGPWDNGNRSSHQSIPTSPPSFLVITMVADRGRLVPPSGQ
jgi:hypothetical protein